jgi:hypothetical protein
VSSISTIENLPISPPRKKATTISGSLLEAEHLRGLINENLLTESIFPVKQNIQLTIKWGDCMLILAMKAQRVRKPCSSWLLFLGKTVEKRKDFFDRHASLSLYSKLG